MKKLILIVAAVLVLGLSIIGCTPQALPPATPTLADISLTKLYAYPSQVLPEKTVTITVVITNTGGMEGVIPLVVKVNGEKQAEDIKPVVLAASSLKFILDNIEDELPEPKDKEQH